jgi:predicted HTH transcriptional regulator
MPNLFDALIRDGEAGLVALVDERRQEDVQLDFKSKADPSRGSANDEDKRTLAEALSGFANSAGGLLIWGIDARKGADQVDCAQSLKPIAEIERFHSAIKGLVGQLIMPRLDGVRTAIIPSSASAGAGYVLLDVERSERRPHRSEAKGKKAYIKRIGDSFFEMEHYDLEDSFKRTQVPDLRFGYE